MQGVSKGLSFLDLYSTVWIFSVMLIGIAVAAALGSDTCTQMWTKMGKKKGLSREEMVEATMVARYMKQATVNDTITNSLALLSTSGE